MRNWILAIVLVAACKGGKEKAKQQAAAKAAVVVAKVETASVLAKEVGKPPFLYVVDDKGVRIAAAESWADLDAGKLKIAKTPTPLDHLDRYVREDFALGRQPSDTVKTMDEYADSPGVAIDLESLEDTTTRENAALDDPPPPEEEDMPDDGEEIGGGPGTTVALDEGKMGKKDSDRAEGQYKMQKNQEDPQLARQQAIEQARNAGILGKTALNAGSGPPGLDIYKRPNEDGTPSRVAQVQGNIAADSTIERFRTMIFIAPTAKATKLIEVIHESDGAIAVSHNGQIRPLRVQFNNRDWGGGAQSWVEARVQAKGLVIEAVPDAPIEVADMKQVAASLDTARKTRGTDDDAPVDVLVDADVDVQRMIDVIVALDTAGIRVIGLGSTPNAEELARRGHRTPTITFGQPNAQGDLDKAIIRRVVREATPKVLDCYTKALAQNRDLEGTVQSQFFIKPDGKVATAVANGFDPDVANCVAEVIKRLEFPKPKGGGGVQVNYPFMMRP